jgi:hypothetical protein
MDTQMMLGTRMEAIQTKVDNSQAEMRFIVFEGMTDMKDARQETTACNESKTTVPDPAMMQSVEEHQEVLRKESAVNASQRTEEAE